jgi:hypothetical protein
MNNLDLEMGIPLNSTNNYFFRSGDYDYLGPGNSDSNKDEFLGLRERECI